jgi:succinate dehydrogenase / fumarate reductase membrane anchor subunit
VLDIKSAPKTGEGAWLWLIKIATGPILIIVAFVHLIVNHNLGSAAGGLLTYEDVVRYYQNPLIPAMEILFLISVVTHSLIGLRSIILDLQPGQGTLKGLDWLFILVGAGSVIYGIWLVLKIASFG